MHKRPSVLFICAGDSTRSQMAAGFLQQLAGDYFEVSSVGIADPVPGPQTARVMREMGVDITGQASTTVCDSLKQHYAYVVSIADTARERSPIFPFTPYIFKWNALNPSIGSEQNRDRLDLHRLARDQIKTRVQSLVRELIPDWGSMLRRTA
jgi:protein-tyrosine-phosphatase